MKINPTTAFLEVGHKIASHPWVYDRIQTLAGQAQSFKRISKLTAALHPEIVVDVGGGTGTWRSLWPTNCRYICLDIELPKLKGFRSKVPGGLAILSDATRMPIAGAAADVVICMAVLHHLTDAMSDKV